MWIAPSEGNALYEHIEQAGEKNIGFIRMWVMRENNFQMHRT